jgi:hypothetical protein
MLFQKITKGQNCPVCKSAGTFRVKRSGLPVKMVCSLLNLRPHWCPECDTFYLGPKRAKDVRVEEKPLRSIAKSSQSANPQPSNLPH